MRSEKTSSHIIVEGAKKISAHILDLSGNAPDDINDFDNPVKVAPKASELSSDTNAFDYTFPPQSVTVFKIRK